MAFRSEMGRVQGVHVPVRVMKQRNKIRETWLMRDIKNQLRKKEDSVRDK